MRTRRATAASSDTLYRVGAISKLVTAAGVMRAADDGRLALDMPAAQALPQWEIQPRHAMAGRASGHRAQPADAAPGHARGHHGRARSDMGYALLGDMVAHAAESPSTPMRRAILRPLNISRAGYQADERMLELRAAGYRRGKPWSEAPLDNAAAEGLWMSSSEMARFSSMLFAEGRYRDTRVLKAESAQAILNLETVADGISLPCRLALAGRALTRTASRATRCVRTAALPKPFIPAMYWPRATSSPCWS